MSDPNLLQASMTAAASASIRDRAKPAFASIATQVIGQFQIKLVSTMVTGVLGSGPVPTFAPPYVPVGPVVGRDGVLDAGTLL
jgi:hypothetical protein